MGEVWEVHSRRLGEDLGQEGAPRQLKGHLPLAVEQHAVVQCSAKDEGVHNALSDKKAISVWRWDEGIL